MATYVLIHGASSDSWYWHRVVPLLRRLGHEVVAPDLPVDDPSAGIDDYVSTAIDAVGERPGPGVVVVGHSLGGFAAPIVADRLEARLLVLVAAMTPKPGELIGAWWDATGWEQARRTNAVRAGRDPESGIDVAVDFFHDLPDDLRAELLARPEVVQTDGLFASVWPLTAWPSLPTRFLLCRQDRFFPAAFQRRVVADRLGFAPMRWTVVTSSRSRDPTTSSPGWKAISPNSASRDGWHR